MTGQIYFRVVIQCIIYPLETGEIEKVLTITEAEAQHSSPCKVSSSKSGAFSFSGKSSFSHGTLIGLLSVAIATVRRLMLLTKVLLKSSWPERKLVANGNKHQLNILPSCKINIFSLLRMGGIHRHKITSN